MSTRYYFKRYGYAGGRPTAGEKSTALPAGTLSANNASGTALEGTIMIGAVPIEGQAVNSFLSDATTAQKSTYFNRFTTRPLAAHTFSGTFTIAMAFAEANAAANANLALSIYIWRPGSSSVVGYLYDSTTTRGSEWSTSETGVVVSGIALSGVTCQDGDVLVVEIWKVATQSMSTGYICSTSYGGATDPVNGTATSDAASYIEFTDTFNELGGGVGFKSATVGASGNPALPQFVADGDLLVAHVAVSSSNDTITPPSGWTSYLRTNHADGTSMEHFWKWYTTGDSAPTFSATSISTTLLEAYTGFGTSKTGNPIDASSGSSASSTTLPVAPSITAAGGNERLVCTVLAWGSGNVSIIPPAGIDSTIGVLSMDSADKKISASGATGTQTFTISSSSNTLTSSVLLKIPPSSTPQTCADSGSGSEAVEVKTKSINVGAFGGDSALQAGTGQDSYTLTISGQTFIWVGDTGTSYDDLGPDPLAYLVVSVPSAETASGTENVIVTGSTTGSDSGTGTEAVSETVLLSVTETASGTENTTTSSAPTVTDTGAGSESPAVQAYYTTPAESGSGNETVTTSGSVLSAETAAGSEVVSTAAIVGSTESGSGGEAPNTLAVIGLGDTATGTESPTFTIALTGADTASGTETVTATGAPLGADSGSGSEAAALSTVLISITDTASGSEVTDTFTPTSFTVTDSSSGTETTAISPVALSSSETGTGGEVGGVSVSSTVTESGAGTEQTSYTALVGPGESGSGTETPDVLAVVGLVDTATGGESSSLIVSLSGSDAASGNEQSIVSGSPTVIDSATGVESTSLIVSVIDAVDSGSGTESASTLTSANPDVTDSAAGTEFTTTSAALTTTETGSGTETPTIIINLGTPTETGSGTESSSTVAVVGLGDTATGAETITMSGSVLSSEAGSGAESSSVGIPQSVTVANSGSGTELISVIKVGELGPLEEHGEISGHPHRPFTRGTQKLIKPAKRFEFHTSDDAGKGTEQVSITAGITIIDLGGGYEVGMPPVRDEVENGTGREFAVISKFDTSESELESFLTLAKVGAITGEEFAILLGEFLTKGFQR